MPYQLCLVYLFHLFSNASYKRVLQTRPTSFALQRTLFCSSFALPREPSTTLSRDPLLFESPLLLEKHTSQQLDCSSKLTSQQLYCYPGPRIQDPGLPGPKTQGAHITLQSSGQDLVAQKGLSCEISIHTPPLGFKNIHASPVLIFPLVNGSLFSFRSLHSDPVTPTGPVDCTVVSVP